MKKTSEAKSFGELLRRPDFRVPDPVAMLQQTGRSMLDLADQLGSGGSPLLQQDKELVRMAYVELLKELWDEELTAFIAGNNADNLHCIREIYTYLNEL